MSSESNLIKNSSTPWLCFKDPRSKLVYFVHSKCACSFYKQLFSKLGWNECASTDIDWKSDKVFSHIRDPLKKHRIGIIEWFYYNNKTSILQNNATDLDFFMMLSRIAYLDHHSLSIYEHLGENSVLVDWIPIDHPTVNHKQQTIDLIEQEYFIDDNIKTWFTNLPPKHVSTGFKKECYNALMELPVDPLIIKSIEYDRFLYDRVTKKNYEPSGYSKQIEYLKSLGMSQENAEISADRDVASGAYINWN